MNENEVVQLADFSPSELMAIKGHARSLPFDPRRDRFELPHSAETNVRPDLNANRIRINGDNVAIATQYPLMTQLVPFFQMLVDNRTPVLVVLASNADINGHVMPGYFAHSYNYGPLATEVTPTGVEQLGDGIEANLYRIEVMGYEAGIEIPVVHVHNWPDHQTVSALVTRNLVALVERTMAEKRAFYVERGSRAAQDPEKLLPVIHCRAGVGRTGQAIAAMAMERYQTMTLAEIIRDMRASRNDIMVQTIEQMETLAEMAAD
ncbi:protein-tyrosine phosphatase family protein [Thaumasiovibrio subtropicus]|uniref:protein-tyrosine phosphatase family protein n=1 Tax=Thaumasiovibrio subtropicus TaxID=1891207 RepID=UPI000B35469B|nr:protein-tyrosine phosphatase family protein [Thaumasiovibrio subtropicus]